MTDSEAKTVIAEMVSFGFAIDSDDACHQLVDMGEIDSTQHATLLSASERKRVYG